MFSRFAQGGNGLRPVNVAVAGTDPSQVKAWRVEGNASERRMFLINKADHPVTVAVDAPGSSALVDRMTPYDPSGSGKTLDATQVRIDGHQVGANGSWPGFQSEHASIHGHTMTITLTAGETAVVTLHAHG